MKEENNVQKLIEQKHEVEFEIEKILEQAKIDYSNVEGFVCNLIDVIFARVLYAYQNDQHDFYTEMSILGRDISDSTLGRLKELAIDSMLKESEVEGK